jgi:transposase
MWEKRTHRWYLILRRVVTRPPDSRPVTAREVLALDPGARKFAAFYRPDGTHGELLRGADSYIQKQALKAALERSRTDTAANHDQWHRHRGRMLRTFARIRNWTRNAHYEAIKTIFTLADFIVAPIFESARMVRRGQRVFGNDTARRLYTWSHYGFSQRLYSKVQTTADKQMAFTREPGTSKTCDRCGAWNAALGGSETFTCRACGYEADRDHHAGRGNLLAALGAAMNVGPDNVER